ncbi:hypothetical protein LUZ61_010681 [Rhynchospora tenuis]|uniref:F-box domain-containing protein n=1 Tax=Rhynchospora tenuis TaxID=198213 RepID=A0AAD6EZJ0_9POAL|nr:hypothetical protein LUZ61_010681 [Rhynchospora tenuis]
MAEIGSCQWSSLPSDLIHLISTKLPDLSDRARMRAVCKAWHFSVSLLDPSPRLPWLVSWDMRGKEEILCYSLSSSKTHKIHCPQLRGAYLNGMAGRYILCCRLSRSISLFNPLTGIEIPLPYSEDGFALGVVSNPLHEDVVVVTGCTHYANWVALIRPGDQTWARHYLNINFEAEVCVYYGGFYYVNQYTRYKKITMEILDATTGEVVTTVSSPDKGSHLISYQNILETSGEILLIYRYKTTGILEDIAFDIYRLDQVRGNYQWVKVRDIGDRMLFLDRFGGFTLKATRVPWI